MTFEQELKRKHPDLFTLDLAKAKGEHLQVRNACGITFLPDLSCLDISGNDRKKLLHSLLSNEIDNLKEGQGNLHHLLTPKGKIQGEMAVYCLPSLHRFICQKDQIEKIQKNIQMRIFRSDIKMEIRQDEFIFLGLYGPQSTEILKKIAHQEIPLEQEYHHTTLDIAGQKVFVCRHHDTGEIGYHLMVPKKGAWELWQVFSPNEGVTPFGQRALTTLRMEAGVPLFGTDFQEDNLSLEINLNKAVSNSKGCYLGQEPVALMLSRGHVAKRLVGLFLEGQHLPEKDTPIWALETDPKNSQAKPEGKITRSLFSPSFNKNIALAFLKYAYLEKNPQGVLQWFSPEGKVQGQGQWQYLPFYQEHGINWLSGGPAFDPVIAPQKRNKNL